MAQACASALTRCGCPLAGSIAGDDTVFVATRSAEQAVALSQTLSRIALQGLSGKNPPRD